MGDGDAPPVWRSLLYALLVCLGSLVSMAFSPAGHAASSSAGWAVLVVLVAMPVVLGACVLLFWRRTHPFALAVGAALVPLVLPIGNTLAFVALAALVGRRRGPAVWWTAGLTTLTSSIVVIRDALASPNSASLTRTIFAPADTPPEVTTPVSAAAVALLAALGIGVSLGSGLLVRTMRLSHAASHRAQAEHRISSRLGDEVARSAERERIAREVHDVMGHRLSIIALHAGVLEGAAKASDTGDPRVQQSAHLVRESAASAVEDLHSLLDLLREPLGTEPPPLPLSRLPQVVEEAVRAGQVVASSIFVEDADHADPTLSRAVHRIIQEILTNARKHAPGQMVTLSVTGSPSGGISIDATNPMPPTAGTAVQGPLRGLVGLSERVELLGGTLLHGVDGDGTVFHVHVDLPWRGP